MAALALLVAGCATRQPAPAQNRPLYNKAELAALPTAEVAAKFLPPAEAARVEKHWIDEVVYLARDRLWDIHLRSRPRPIGADICERTDWTITFYPAKRAAGDERPEMPAWAGDFHRRSDHALAPGCRDLPGLSFARDMGVGDDRLTDEQSIAILRALASAQAAAAGSSPLTFRLSCVNYSFEKDACAGDLRAILAGLPLHRAFSVERHPHPHNCSGLARDEGDAVEIGDPEDRSVWDVRLRHLGTDKAEVSLIRQFSRTHVLC
jgi:hypothetical protein